MIMKKLKVIIACGSGAVTSTMCSGIVKEIAENNGISAEVTTCSIMEFESQHQSYDVKFTTMGYKFPEEEKYAMNIFPLIAAKKCNIKIRISHSHNSDVQDKNILIKISHKTYQFDEKSLND